MPMKVSSLSPTQARNINITLKAKAALNLAPPAASQTPVDLASSKKERRRTPDFDSDDDDDENWLPKVVKNGSGATVDVLEPGRSTDKDEPLPGTGQSEDRVGNSVSEVTGKIKRPRRTRRRSSARGTTSEPPGAAADAHFDSFAHTPPCGDPGGDSPPESPTADLHRDVVANAGTIVQGCAMSETQDIAAEQEDVPTPSGKLAKEEGQVAEVLRLLQPSRFRPRLVQPQHLGSIVQPQDLGSVAQPQPVGIGGGHGSWLQPEHGPLLQPHHAWPPEHGDLCLFIAAKLKAAEVELASAHEAVISRLEDAWVSVRAHGAGGGGDAAAGPRKSQIASTSGDVASDVDGSGGAAGSPVSAAVCGGDGINTVSDTGSQSTGPVSTLPSGGKKLNALQRAVRAAMEVQEDKRTAAAGSQLGDAVASVSYGMLPAGTRDSIQEARGLGSLQEEASFSPTGVLWGTSDKKSQKKKGHIQNTPELLLQECWNDVALEWGKPKFMAKKNMNLSDATNDIEKQQVGKFRGIDPGSIGRVLWDCTTCLFICYEAFTVPMSVFDPPETGFGESVAWIARFFWNLDFPLTFFTGYVESGSNRIELGLKKIARKYLTSWFAFDFLCIFIDWFEVIFASQGSEQSMGRFARVAKNVARPLRLFRLLRVLRLRRMEGFFEKAMMNVKTAYVSIGFVTVKTLLLIIFFGHLMACAWYIVGISAPNRGWVGEHEVHVGAALMAKFGYRYCTALQWGLAQFSGGFDEVPATSFHERLFVVSMYVFAFILQVLFVSNLTSAMCKLEIVTSAESQSITQLKKFLQSNKVSTALGSRIMNNAACALKAFQSVMPESSIELLQYVAEPLRMEMHFEMYTRALEKHPFFASYKDACPQAVRQICHGAVSYESIVSGDIIFEAGKDAYATEDGPSMVFVIQGELKYIDSESQGCTLEAGEYCGEPVLWLSWVYQGTLVAKTDCRLCLLSARKFQEVATKAANHTASGFEPYRYAEAFLKFALRLQDFLTELSLNNEEDVLMSAELQLDKDGMDPDASGRISRLKKRASEAASLNAGSLRKAASVLKRSRERTSEQPSTERGLGPAESSAIEDSASGLQAGVGPQPRPSER